MGVECQEINSCNSFIHSIKIDFILYALINIFRNGND